MKLSNPLSDVVSSIRSVLKMRKETERAVERMRENSWEETTIESVYPRPSRDACEEQVADTTHLLGRRFGFSGGGKKIHVVREIAYGDNSFLCGRLKDPTRPLFLSLDASRVGELCSSCDRLARRGIQ